MSEKIISYGTTASNVRVERGFYAVDPNGHVVLLRPSAVVKHGWRLATEADIKTSAVLIGEGVTAAEAELPAPPRSPMFLGRTSLSDKESAAIPSDSPRTKRSD